MVDEISGWATRLPERSRYGIVSALRQTLSAAERWGYMSSPGRTGSRRRARSARSRWPSSTRSPQYRTLPAFVAATGLRPEEWAPLERRDVDRQTGVVSVRRTVSDGEVVELGKTDASRRQVPLSRRAVAALEALPARLDTPLLWPAPAGGRAAPRRQLPRVASRRGGRDRKTGPPVRPALDVRFRTRLPRRDRVRARPRDGHQCRDDRAALRDAARRRARGDRRAQAPGRVRGRTPAGRRRRASDEALPAQRPEGSPGGIRLVHNFHPGGTTIHDLTGRYRATDSGPGGVRWCSGSSRFYESISGARTAWPA